MRWYIEVCAVVSGCWGVGGVGWGLGDCGPVFTVDVAMSFVKLL